jgi:hypothetical protein
MKKKWPKLDWPVVIDRVSKIVFQIVTPSASGTGFVVSRAAQPNSSSVNYMMATAWHVVERLKETEATLHFISSDRSTVAQAKAGHYQIFCLGPTMYDTAIVMFRVAESIVDERDLLPMLHCDWMMPRGAELGWLGFPGIVESQVCFFRGVVSGFLNSPPTYLVDGVAINGVSGAPVFDNRAHIVGLISAYLPNPLNPKITLLGISAVVPIHMIRYWMENQVKARVL